LRHNGSRAVIRRISLTCDQWLALAALRADDVCMADEVLDPPVGGVGISAYLLLLR
jgi:hypothetical protein